MTGLLKSLLPAHEKSSRLTTTGIGQSTRDQSSRRSSTHTSCSRWCASAVGNFPNRRKCCRAAGRSVVFVQSPIECHPSAVWSRGLLYNLAVLPDDQGKLHRAVLGPHIFGGTTHRAFSPPDKRRNFRSLGCVSVLLHGPISFRTASLSCVDEIASRFAGSLRLSQIVQRVASER